jgi:hypothetical protein
MPHDNASAKTEAPFTENYRQFLERLRAEGELRYGDDIMMTSS